MMRARLMEILGILLVGDGVVAFLNPERHTQLWRRGPKFWQEMMDPFVQYPVLMRWAGAVEAALGLWLASRQRPQTSFDQEV